MWKGLLFSLALGAASGVVGTASAVPLIAGMGGTLGFGDLAMLPNDDGSSNELPLPFSINFFGNTFSSFYINNNGNITFNGPLFSFTPEPFPITDQPMIAPYWADVDTRNQSLGGGLNNVYVGSPNSDTVIVTWHMVGYYQENIDKLNDFQAVIVNRPDTGAGNFDIMFRYNQLQWTTGDASEGEGGLGGIPAQAGYDAGDNTNFLALPGSFTNDVLNLQNTSNVSVDTPGLWLMLIRNGMTSDGSTPETPLLPEIVTEEGWHFDFEIDLNQQIFIDPMVAIGYDYIVDSGPNFESVLLPALLGQVDPYEVLFGSLSFLVNAGDQFFFTDHVAGGVNAFSVRGIQNGLDPNDTTAFVTGLTFVSAGAVQMRQVPFVVNQPVGVPEPSPIALLLTALGSAVLIGARRRRSLH